MAARSGSWSARLGPCSAPPAPAPWPHSTSGTCHKPARKTQPRPWARLAQLLSHNPGLQRGRRQAFQGHGNMQFFKIEMKNLKKKSLGIKQLLSPYETWSLMESVRAEKGLKGYLIPAPVLQTGDRPAHHTSGRANSGIRMSPLSGCWIHQLLPQWAKPSVWGALFCP